MKLEQNGFFVRSPPNCGGCGCSLKVATKGLLLTRDKSVKESKILGLFVRLDTFLERMKVGIQIHSLVHQAPLPLCQFAKGPNLT